VASLLARAMHDRAEPDHAVATVVLPVEIEPRS
jgi:hypothetical protein